MCEIFPQDTWHSRIVAIFKDQFHHGAVKIEQRHNRSTNTFSGSLDGDLIREHINSFQPVPSHYCRKKLVLLIFRRTLMCRRCMTRTKYSARLKKVPPVKKYLYRRIFYHDFKIKFHQPRKDLCDACFAFCHASPEIQEQLSANHSAHTERTKHVIFMTLQRRAIEEDVIFFEFDMEAVRFLSIEAKSIFYQRLLSV